MKTTGKVGGKRPSRSKAIIAVMKRIINEFPDEPAGHLMAAVVTRAVQDLACGDKKAGAHVQAQAAAYLRGEMWHALIGGVDPEWIRRVLKEAGLRIDAEAFMPAGRVTQ